MKKSLTIALLALTGCAPFQAFAPETTEKTIALTKKGLDTYCDKVPLTERLTIRNKISTPERRIMACCNLGECEALFGKSYIEGMQK